MSIGIQVLYADHHSWLLGWLRRRLGCPHGAADVAQDTFLRILASRDALLAMREPRAFLTTTAQRLLIDRARRQTLERTYLAELAALAQQNPGFAPSPEDSLAVLQALEQISAVLEGLPPKPARAFLLYFLEGEPQPAIAAALGVSTRMVRKYLLQALLHCHAAASHPP